MSDNRLVEDEAKSGKRGRLAGAGLWCGLFLLMIFDVVSGWSSSSSLDRAVDVVLVVSFGMIALDTLQRKVVVSRESLMIRYMFRWRIYPIPATAEIQDWGHSVAVVDRVTYRPLFILPRYLVGGARGVKQLQASRPQPEA